MKAFLAALVLGLMVIAKTLNAAPLRVEDQVVRLIVTKKETDRSSPWQSEDIVQQSFLAVVLPGGELLSTAFAAADAVFLEIQRFGSSRRDEAELVFVDYEANLALIRPLRPQVLEGTRPMVLGEELPLGTNVSLYKVHDTYNLSQIAATLQEVGVTAPPTSSYGTMSYSLKVQQTGLGWAEPVILGDKLVAITAVQDQNFLRAIPANIIRHFLSDHRDQTYRGFPDLGIQLDSLIAPEKRSRLEIRETNVGVRVAKVYPSSGFANNLRNDDVILAIDDQPLSDQGYLSHKLWGKVPLRFLLNEHFGGDDLKLKIIRQGQPLEIKGKLRRANSNRAPILNYRFTGEEPHLIFAGLIFEELSEDYLKQWGKEWRDAAPLEFLYQLNLNNEPTVNGNQRIIFISRILADPINRGYSEMRNRRVTKVNGHRIDSMAGLLEAFKAPIMRAAQEYALIKLAPEGDEIILSYKGLNDAHKRIAATYGVKETSFFSSGNTKR